VEIKPYVEEVDATRINQWIQQMEVYLNMYEVIGKQNISFSQLNLEGHALAWWESDVVIRALGN
jgi:hypothetical protein